MPIGKINCMLRDKKDHYVVTLYKEFRKNKLITKNNILLLRLNGFEFIRIPNSDFHITIPKRFVKDDSKRINLEILKIWDIESAKKRAPLKFRKGYVNIESFIPHKSTFDKDIYVLHDNNRYIYVWYSVGGGAKHVRLNNYVTIEKLSELSGFYFGDGNTSVGIRSFRLNNCEPSVLNYCLDILDNIGLPRKIMKVQIIYSTPAESIKNTTQSRCINYWSKILGLKKNQIVSVTKSKGLSESLRYGSARIFLDNSVFVEVLLNGVLPSILNSTRNPKIKKDQIILGGFLRGLAAAEGSVTLTKLGSLSKISLSFDPHSEDLSFYRKVLLNAGINSGGTKGNELYIYGINNFKVLNNINIFKMHNMRRDKFDLGYKNHKFS